MSTRELTAANFEQTVTGNDIVLVDFGAAWCGPCRMFAPVYDKAAQQHPGSSRWSARRETWT